MYWRVTSLSSYGTKIVSRRFPNRKEADNLRNKIRKYNSEAKAKTVKDTPALQKKARQQSGME